MPTGDGGGNNGQKVYGIWAINGASGSYRTNSGTILWSNPTSGNHIQSPLNLFSSPSIVTNLARGFNNNGPKLSPASTAGASGVNKCVSSLNFAQMQSRQFLIMMGGTATAYIGGTANTQLQNTGAESATNVRRPIAFSEGRKTRKVVTAGWNWVTGRPLSEPSVSTDSFGTDNTAHDNKTLPGELVYTDSQGLSVKQDTYKPKTG